MRLTIVLDAGPLGMICHPNPRGEAVLCQQWALALRIAGRRVVIPEVTDYEVRRELIRAGRPRAITLLDDLHVRFDYLELDTAQLRLAAELWARVRQLGLPTAGPESLDADAIVAAQGLSLNDPNVIVATSNPVHIR